jgi:hypothetical protein
VIDPPSGLALATTIGYSSAAPSAIISATWVKPTGVEPQRYVLQLNTNNTFPDATNISKTTPMGQTSAAIDGLLPATLYYARVAAQYTAVQSAWSATASITSASDTVPAGVPTSIAAAFIGTGDLLITWTNPTEANFKIVKVVIRASSGGTTYRTVYAAGGSFLYTTAMNLADTGGVGDASLYVELTSMTFSNVLGTTVNTGLITKAAPSAPTLTQSWSGDTGTAAADLTLSWTAVSDARIYRLTLNGGTARDMAVTTYTYTLDANIAQNGSADPTVTYSLVAVDGLGQSSTAASGTATNAAPATPTATLDPGAVSGLYARVTSTAAPDFLQYEYLFKRDGSTVATLYSKASTIRYEMQGAGDDGFHSWSVTIRQEDVFAQFSSSVTPSAVAFEALTLSSLRAMAAYSDSDSNSQVTLAALKDGIVSSGGVSYAA